MAREREEEEEEGSVFDAFCDARSSFVDCFFYAESVQKASVERIEKM